MPLRLIFVERSWRIGREGVAGGMKSVRRSGGGLGPRQWRSITPGDGRLNRKLPMNRDDRWKLALLKCLLIFFLLLFCPPPRDPLDPCPGHRISFLSPSVFAYIYIYHEATTEYDHCYYHRAQPRFRKPRKMKNSVRVIIGKFFPLLNKRAYFRIRIGISI